MRRDALRELLEQVDRGEVSVEGAIDRLRALPFETVDGATVDHHRVLRDDFGEVVFCEGKTPEQVARILAALAKEQERLLGTRASIEHFEAARLAVPDLAYDAVARILYVDRQASREMLDGVAVVAAGTSDLPVAEEAARTLRVFGHEPVRITDVGVAGIHRLLAETPRLQSMNAIVVVAGMEGALSSVVAGLVGCPVVAVPTSVGYGAHFGGVTPLLGMMTSCAAGVSVVNIDNGFGAAYIAASINRGVHRAACGGGDNA